MARRIRKSVMSPTLSRVLALIALVTGLLPPAPAVAAPTVIDFEAQQGAVERIGEVEFPGAVEVGTCESETCISARSGNQVARKAGFELERPPIEAVFDQPQARVTTWVRADAQFDDTAFYTPLLRAFDQNGVELDRHSFNTTTDNVWLPLTVETNLPLINRIELSAELSESAFDNFVALDDLTFTPESTLDDDAPHLTILAPSPSTITGEGAIEVEVEVEDDQSIAHVEGRVLENSSTLVDTLRFCGVDGADACPSPPITGPTHFTGDDTAGLPNSAYYLIEVTACDDGGNCSTAEVTVIRDVPFEASFLSEFQPDIEFGGRAVAVDVRPGVPDEAIVGTESGGFFRTTNGGSRWAHIDALPFSYTSDVRFDPEDGNVVLATVTYSEHVENQAGIWRSEDGGVTWTRPEFDWNADGIDDGWDPASDATGPCVDSATNSAWGISFEPNSDKVYVGLDCGVAVSADGGQRFTLETIPGTSRPIYSVSAQEGVVDACGLDGMWRRYTFFGMPWQGAGLPAGAYCSGATAHGLSPSPFDPFAVFAALTFNEPDRDGRNQETRYVYEGHHDLLAGTWTWADLEAPSGTNREPFVVAHLDSDGELEVHFGNGSELFRQTCRGIGSLECRAAGSAWKKPKTDHPDETHVAYASSEPGCPLLLTSDGGIHATNDCGASWPIAANGKGGFGALQIYNVEGQVRPDHTDLYIGTHDNRSWASKNGGVTWPGSLGHEGFFLQVPPTGSTSHTGRRVVTLTSCEPCSNLQAKPHFTGENRPWKNPPVEGNPGNPFLVEDGVHVQLADDQDLWLREDGKWRKVGKAVEDGTELLHVVGPASDPTVYVVEQTGGKRVLRVATGIRDGSFAARDAFGSGQDVLTDIARRPFQFVWAEVFEVNPGDPDEVIAADIGSGDMRVTKDGGLTWTADSELTGLIEARERHLVTRAFSSDPELLFKGRDGVRAQATAIGYAAPTRVFVGTQSAGLLTSDDDGRTWERVPGSETTTNPTDFYFGSRSRDESLVSTWGRGLWRIDLPRTDLRIGYEALRDEVAEGDNLAFGVDIENISDRAAPHGWAVLSLPEDVSLAPSEICSTDEDPRLVYCFFPSLPAGGRVNFELELTMGQGMVPDGKDSTELLSLALISMPLGRDIASLDNFRGASWSVTRS